MKKNRKLIFAILGLVVLAAIVVYVSFRVFNILPSQVSDESSENALPVVLVEYSQEGFAPEEVVLEVGDVLVIQNNTDMDFELYLSRKPLEYTGPLNPILIPEGESGEMKFTVEGDYEVIRSGIYTQTLSVSYGEWIGQEVVEE